MSLINQEDLEAEVKKETDTSEVGGLSVTVEGPEKDRIHVNNNQADLTLENNIPYKGISFDEDKIIESTDDAHTSSIDLVKTESNISISQTTMEDCQRDRIQDKNKEGHPTKKYDVPHQGTSFNEAKINETADDAQTSSIDLVKTESNLSIGQNILKDPHREMIQEENKHGDLTLNSDIPHEGIVVGEAKINETTYDTQTSVNALLETETNASIDQNLDEHGSDILEDDLVLKWDEDDVDIDNHGVTEEIPIQSSSNNGDGDGLDSSQNNSGDKIQRLNVNVDVDSCKSTALKSIINTSSVEFNIENNETEQSVASVGLNNEGSKPTKLQNVTKLTNDKTTEKLFEKFSCVIDEPAALTSSCLKPAVSDHLTNEVDIQSSTESEEATHDVSMETEDSTQNNKVFKHVTNEIPIKIEDNPVIVSEKISEITTSKPDCYTTNVIKITTASNLDIDTLEDNLTAIAVDPQLQPCKLGTMTELPPEESKMDITDFIKNNRELSDIMDISADLGLKTDKSKLSESISISSVNVEAAKDKLKSKDDVANTSKHTDILSNISDTIDGNVKIEVTENIIKKELMSLGEAECSLADNLSHLKDVKIENSIVKSEPSEIHDLQVDKSPILNKLKSEETVKKDPETQPSTSEQFDDDLLEATDSLGLLAESSRVMDDDEEMEEDEDGDDGDEEDYDQDDESSNQMTAEHSEDSNAPQSESDLPREHTDTDTDNAQETVKKDKAITSPKDQVTLEKKVSTPPQEEICDNDNGLQGADEPGSSPTGEQDGGFQIEIANIVSGTTSESKDMEVEDLDLDAELGEQTEQGIDGELTTRVDALAETIDKESGESIPIGQIPEIECGVSESTDLETVVPKELSSEKETNIQKTSLLKSLLEDTDEAMSPVCKRSKRSPKKAEDEIISCSINLESSSEDEMPDASKSNTNDPEEMTCVNLPNDIEIMSSGAKTCDIVTKEGEVVISGVPKPKLPQKTIEDPLLPKEDKPKSPAKYGLEVFNLDSDDEEETNLEVKDTSKTSKKEESLKKEIHKCINFKCKSDTKEQYLLADVTAMAYYDYSQKKKAMVCQPCADVVTNRLKGLLEGLENMTPLLDLDFKSHNEDFVEISDSESEEELDVSTDPEDRVGVVGAKLLEEELTDMMNMTWKKYNMDDRLEDAVNSMSAELDRLQKESIEMNTLLTECQNATDQLRNDFYETFERKYVEVPALLIYDTPHMQYETPEEPMLVPPTSNAQSTSEPTTETETRKSKRKLSAASEQPAKKPAIPLGYTPLDNNPTQIKQEKESKIFDSRIDYTSFNKTDDDNADVSVVKLSAEAAPDSLPPPGELVRTPVRVGMTVFAMRNAFGSWLKAKIVECQPKGANTQFTMCRVKFEHKVKNPCKLLPARCLAYSEPTEVRMVIGTRVIALFKDDNNTSKGGSYYSGVVAEMPNPVNNYRYLVFFDDGYAQYVQHCHTRLVCECSALVWEEVHPFSREFVRQYLRAYPERPMVRLHAGQSLKTEWNGKWWASKVIKVDASLVNVHFEEDNRTEWIYRGSTRLAPLYLELQAAERHRARPLPRSTSNKAPPKANMPYVEYTRSDEQGNDKPVEPPPPPQTEDVRRQRAVAKKSTAIPSQPVVPQQANLDTVTSRVVYYTPKNAVKPYKMTPHVCGPKCKRTDVLALKDLRTYNPLAKPLLSGWERQIVRYKGYKQVMYRTPCGRRVRNVRELHYYLRMIQSDMSVDLFDFGPNTHCLAEFVLNKCIVSKKDLSHGKENVPVPCVNYYDDALPEFCLYNTERTPTEGVPLNTDPEFLCGCDCTDDCEDKSKCACWQLTLEGAHTIGYDGDDVGYVYRRLPEPLPSGIYECNSRCKCKSTCLNRVAQHPLQLKLQVFKTLNRGWGIRALNDVPKGSFLCVYAGNLLTDATANLDGLNEGDEYLAELDYIEVVEQLKEGYEEDIPEADKELDRKCSLKSAKNSDESSSSDDEGSNKDEEKDDDFRPKVYDQGFGVQEFSTRLRKRDRRKDKAEKSEEKKDADDEECITISDDEEVREPSRFMAQAGMGANEFVSKYRSVRAHFGRDEACYIMDAKVQGNIGRYLNHSCTPNVFVQNVFVDTHDPRFPWVAFFALSHIRAGTELTWNYNYDVGSVPGKVLYCYCGAPNCRGRLL